MVAIASASVTAGVCPEEVPDRIASLLVRHGLALETKADSRSVFEAALHDKKRSGDAIDLVVPRGIGSASIARTPIEEFKRILEVGLACAEAYADRDDAAHNHQETRDA